MRRLPYATVRLAAARGCSCTGVGFAAQSAAMRIRTVIAIAFIVAALSFYSTADRVAGAHRAARNSAAFSALVFSIALARRGGATPATVETGLTMNFVAAHAVHYSAVASVMVLDVASDLHNMRRGAPFVIAFGVTLLAIVAATARGKTRAKSIANSIAMYVVWALFTIAFSSRGLKGDLVPAVMFAIMLLALGVRITRGFTGRQKRALAAAG
jgi:hypothetical protein